MILPAAFIEKEPRRGEFGIRYQVYDPDGVEVAAGRGENAAQAEEVARRLLKFLCDLPPESAPVPF